MAEGITGIEIGSMSLCFALHKGDDTRLVTCRLPENMVSDSDTVVAPQALSTFIQQQKSEHNINVADCALVLPSNQAYFRATTVPMMSIKELKINLPYEFRDFITDDPDSYYYDYMVDKTNEDEAGNKMSQDLYAAAVRKSVVSDYEDILHHAGFRLKKVLPVEYVLSRVMFNYVQNHPEDSEREFALIEIDADSTMVTFFKGFGYLASRTIDLGTHIIDEAIADEKGVDLYTASTYRRSNFDSVLESQACSDAYSTFAVEINKIMNYFNFNYPDNSLEDCYFLGAGSRIPGLTQSISDLLQKSCQGAGQLFPENYSTLEDIDECALSLALSLDL